MYIYTLIIMRLSVIMIMQNYCLHRFTRYSSGTPPKENDNHALMLKYINHHLKSSAASTSGTNQALHSTTSNVVCHLGWTPIESEERRYTKRAKSEEGKGVPKKKIIKEQKDQRFQRKRKKTQQKKNQRLFAGCHHCVL